jgi:hypothetical protein
MTLTVLFHPSSSADLALRNSFDSDVFVPCILDFAGSGATYAFSGSVAGLGLSIPMAEGITQDVTIRTTGKPVLSGTFS